MAVHDDDEQRRPSWERRASSAERRRRGRTRPTREQEVLGLSAELTDEVEARLADLVLRAQTGDAAARNAIYAMLELKIRRWVEREWWAIRSRAPMIESGDVAGEAFLVLAELIEHWPGEGGFGAYVMRVFPWRLKAAVRVQAGLPVRSRETRGGDRPWEGPLSLGDDAEGSPVAGLGAEESYLSQQTVILLEALALSLDDADQRVLIWRVRDGRSMTEIARHLGLSRRQVHRRWKRLALWIRAEWAA